MLEPPAFDISPTIQGHQNVADFALPTNHVEDGVYDRGTRITSDPLPRTDADDSLMSELEVAAETQIDDKTKYVQFPWNQDRATLINHQDTNILAALADKILNTGGSLKVTC
jgi:hypothetical protein